MDNNDVLRSTKGSCKNCHADIGEFYNAWNKITTTYFLPALVGSYHITGLKPVERPRKASIGSELDGCNIQPLACEKCNESLGVVCTQAPADKSSFSDREFLKLPRIQLRSAVTGQVVELIIEKRIGSASTEEAPLTVSASEMEQPPAATVPPATHQQQQHQQRAEVEHQIHPPPSPYPPIAPPQKPPDSDNDAALSAAARPREHVVPVASPVNGHVQTNGHPSTASSEDWAVAMNAIHRLQTQVSYNMAGLATQSRETATIRSLVDNVARDVARIDSAVGRLNQEIRNMEAAIDLDRREIHSRLEAEKPQYGYQEIRLDDSTLEVLSKNLNSVAAKANEVDGMQLQIELLKRRLQRMEEAAAKLPAVGVSGTSHRETSVQQAPLTVAHASPPISHGGVGVRHDSRPSSSHLQQPLHHQHQHQSPYPPMPTQQHLTLADPRYHTPVQNHHIEQSSQAGGWVSVNPSAKRGPPNGIDARADEDGTALGSPKRPKLAPLEPRRGYDVTTHSQIVYERMDTDDDVSGRRTDSHESVPHSMHSSNFTPIAYASTNEVNPDDSWRTESQRASIYHTHEQPSPRRGGRGGGKVGRPRKSLPTDMRELGTPEWEKPDWTGSQAGPDSYYQLNTPGGTKRGTNIIRRGSGGGGTASVRGFSADPYAHTKKSRTKPVRNSDGILIRKDGRPDMRSQSSAANLRKVHARKEQEKAMEQGQTPTSGLATAPVLTGATSSRSSSAAAHDEPPSTQDRHEAIMNQMFPRGVDEQRARMNFAEQFFPAGSSPVDTKPPVGHDSPVPETQPPAEAEKDVDSTPAKAGPEDEDTDSLDEEERAERADSDHRMTGEIGETSQAITAEG